MTLDTASNILWDALQYCIDAQAIEGRDPYNPDDPYSKARAIFHNALRLVAIEATTNDK